MAHVEKLITYTEQWMEYYEQGARKMYDTYTKGAIKRMFRKWHQKAKAHLSRYNTTNPTAPQLEWDEWETVAHKI